MSFSQEPISSERSDVSIAKHGEDTPFRHHSVIRKYVESLVNRNGYSQMVSYNTTVELAEKVGSEWRLVLRGSRETDSEDEWWEERFDALVVAGGHYSVPYIPKIEGLEAFERARPGSVKHSKMFRGRDAYKGKVEMYAGHLLGFLLTIFQKIIVVGASVSAADIAYDLVNVARGPLYAVVLGHTMNSYFGDEAFKHPNIATRPSIANITTSNNERTVHFIDGTSVSDVDAIIFGTGYTWSLPFLPIVEVRNNRVPGLYQHVVYQKDPTLLFVGAVGAGLTFKIFEWQAVLAARVLSGRATLPSLEEQQHWEQELIRKKGDGPAFTVVFPEFESYFETVRELAGNPGKGQPGRKLPSFEQSWLVSFMAGHEIRKAWWKAENSRERQKDSKLLDAKI
jgi:hypothetical protein